MNNCIDFQTTLEVMKLEFSKNLGWIFRFRNGSANRAGFWNRSHPRWRRLRYTIIEAAFSMYLP